MACLHALQSYKRLRYDNVFGNVNRSRESLIAFDMSVGGAPGA